MNAFLFAGAVALALALAACGEPKKYEPTNEAVADGLPASEVARVYSGTGRITAIAGDKVTIAHGPIVGIGWPAMTMTFTAPPGTVGSVQADKQVDFSFRQDGSSFVLTSLRPR